MTVYRLLILHLAILFLLGCTPFLYLKVYAFAYYNIIPPPCTIAYIKHFIVSGQRYCMSDKTRNGVWAYLES